MNRLILNIIVTVLLAFTATGCLSITRVDDKDKKAAESKMVVTPTTIVNLRTGPGTNYQIVTGLQPGMELTVINNASDEWMEVSTDDGMKGYVSSKYVKAITKEIVSDDIVYDDIASNDIVKGNEVTEEESSLMSDSEDSPLVSDAPAHRYGGDSFFASYMNFMTSAGGYFFTLILFIAEICAVLFLHKKYDYVFWCTGTLVPAGTALIAITISAVLTVFQILAIFSVRNYSSAMDPYFILMLLSTGYVMADTPWRLRMSGLLTHCRSLGKEGDSRVNKATMLGNVTWTILLIPVAILYLQYAGCGPHKIFAGNTHSFWSMVWAMVLFGAGGWLFCGIIWPKVIVKYLLTSLNSVLLCILNIILVFGIVKYEYYSCDASFTGLTFLVSLFLLVMSACFYVGPMFTTINERRCSNCHSFDGEYSHTTDLGSTVYTSKGWRNCGTSGISPRHSDAVISDSQELVSTTKLTKKWKTHHTCAYCDHKWELENQSTEVIDSHVEKRSWKETYLK